MIAEKLVTLVSVFSLCLLCAFSSLTRAQTPTGLISGVVTDLSGARVAGARVKITNRDSGLRRNLTTSTEGEYSAAALPSGLYQMALEAAGFRRLERTIVVAAGTTTTVNLSIQI